MVVSPNQGVKLGAGPSLGNQLTMRIIKHKQEQSTGNLASILALKPMNRVNQDPKQKVPMTPQNGDL